MEEEGFIVAQTHTQIELGQTHTMGVQNAIAIGYRADADSFGIAVGPGARAGKRAAAFGVDVVAEDDRLVILNWDLTDVGSRLDKLEKLVAAQQNIIENQEELIKALWFHPGMPGAAEAESSFNCARNKLT